MKLQIRRGAFETNSSSMHSLIIKNGSSYFSPEEIREGFYIGNNGVVYIETFCLRFGRSPFMCLSSFRAKWYYAYASLSEMRDELVQLLKELIPGCKSVRICRDDYVYSEGDVLYHFLKRRNIPVREFLMNKKYVVIVDGDEYDVWGDVEDAGLVNKDAIAEQVWCSNA